MFTGFPTENTPAIQVWDYSNTFSNVSSGISLTSDCAPIQIIKTGAAVAQAIIVYLPPAPIEGKIITIVNQKWGTVNSGLVNVVSSDTSGNGSSSILFNMFPGEIITICYSKYFIGYTPGATGTFRTGWVNLTKGSASSTAANSIVLGGSSNSTYALNAAVFGGNNNSSSGANSAIVGGATNTINGTTSGIAGGSTNSISAGNCFIGGGANNDVSVDSSTIVGGTFNIANNSRTAVVGGTSNQSNSPDSAVIGGQSNRARSNNSAVIGSSSSQTGTTNFPYSVVIGGQTGITTAVASTAFPSGRAGTLGSAQTQLFTFVVTTTNATTTSMSTDGAALSNYNQITVGNSGSGGAVYFQGKIVAGVAGGGNTKGWAIEGVLKRAAGSATITLVGVPTVTSSFADAGAAAWTVAVSANNFGLGIAGLKIDVTGAAATTIAWRGTFMTTELTH